MIYGFCRISTIKQNLQRQVQNILRYNSEAKIIEEKFTGTTTDRPEWNKLKKGLRIGDTIIFDSVSRMSRNSDEGIQEYMDLMQNGITLIFLKEPYINTEVYQEQLNAYTNIKTEEDDLKPLFEGIQETLKRLAAKQIMIAFNQSEKEVKDLSQRTKEALKVLNNSGVKLGHNKKSLITKKSIEMKEKIRKINKRFNGNMNDTETLDTLKIARNTFYKYIKEINL